MLSKIQMRCSTVKRLFYIKKSIIQTKHYNVKGLFLNYLGHVSPFVSLLQVCASLCTRLWPVKLQFSLLLPSWRLNPNPQTSTCLIWDHATMEPAQTSTAWSLRSTFDPNSPPDLNTYMETLTLYHYFIFICQVK